MFVKICPDSHQRAPTKASSRNSNLNLEARMSTCWTCTGFRVYRSYFHIQARPYPKPVNLKPSKSKTLNPDLSVILNPKPPRNPRSEWREALGSLNRMRRSGLRPYLGITLAEGFGNPAPKKKGNIEVIVAGIRKGYLRFGIYEKRIVGNPNSPRTKQDP